MRIVGVDDSRTVAEIAYLERGRLHPGGRIGVERCSLQRFAKGDDRSCCPRGNRQYGRYCRDSEALRLSRGCCQPVASPLDRGSAHQDG